MFLAAVLLAGLVATPPADEVSAPAGSAIPFVLRWDAPSGCPGITVLMRSVARYAQHAVVMSTDAEVHVDAVIWREAEHAWRAEVSIATPSGRGVRTVAADTCDGLTDGVAVIVSLALDGVAEVALPLAPRPATPMAERAQPARVQALIGVEGGLGLGLTPRVNGALTFAGGVALGHFRLQAVGHYITPRRTAVGPDGSAEVRVQLWSVGLRLGYAPEVGRLQVPMWVGADGGQLHGTGRGLAPSRAATRPFSSVWAGVGLAWKLHARVALGVGADLVVPLVRAGFEIGNLGVVQEVGVVAMRAGLRASVRVGR